MNIYLYLNLDKKLYESEEKMSTKDIRETMEGRILKLEPAISGLYQSVPVVDIFYKK